MKIKNVNSFRKRLCIAAALFMTTVITNTGDAILEGYRNFISQNLSPAINSLGYKIYGFLHPLQEHNDYHFSVTFYIPLSESNTRSREMTGVSIPGEECTKPGGATSSAPSSLIDDEWKNNVITEAYCSSGRVTVALISLTGGEKKIIYDGLFQEGREISFSGVPGKYNAGVLQLMSTDRSEPIGELVPINECQKDGTC